MTFEFHPFFFICLGCLHCYCVYYCYNYSWILCITCTNVVFLIVYGQIQCFLNLILNNNVLCWNMGLGVKGRPKCKVTFHFFCFLLHFVTYFGCQCFFFFFYFSIENKCHISYLNIKFYKLWKMWPKWFIAMHCC
jgi:hypothetical protein